MRGSRAGASTRCTHTRPRPSIASTRVSTWSSRPAPRPASRSATSCRSSTPPCAVPTTPHSSSSRPRRWRRTSCGRCEAGWSPGSARSPTTATRHRTTARWARKNATVVLTNPEMIHQGILPFHQRWSTFLMRLRLVVVDELHATAWHLRQSPRQRAPAAPTRVRALRLRPDVLLRQRDDRQPRRARVDACSARRSPSSTTTARRRPNAASRCGSVRSSTPRPAHGHRPTSRRPSCSPDSSRAGQPTLAFTRSRRGAELVAGHARRILATRAPERADRVAAYRAGYLPEERRELEQQLTSGALLGVAATNALELGIDVGGLDAVVMNGFPGTLASLRQQAGRAGRSDRRAAAVLVAGDDQLDQWYAQHPDELFTRPAEAAVVNPQNPFVLEPHVACAAHELPLDSRRRRRGSDPASTTPCARSCSRTGSSRAVGRCTGPVGIRRRRASGCAAAPAPSSRSSHRTIPISR